MRAVEETPAIRSEELVTDAIPAAPKKRFPTLHWRSKLEPVALPFGAIVVSLILFGVFCAGDGANPFAVFHSIYRGAFGSWFAFQSTLVRAAPLMLCALATAIPIRLGLIVIGNEGAFVMGGLCATIVGLKMPESSPMTVHVAMAATGLLVGGLWIMAVGALKHYRGVNETICSLLLNYIAIAILNQAVNTWIKDPASLNKPSSFPIPDEQMLQPIGETSLHWGMIFGPVACLLAWFLLKRTTFGFKIRTIGANLRAAQIAGISVGPITLIACFLAGAGPGLAGMVEVAAVQGSANESLNAGYGYGGILVAFLARQNPMGCILISILLGGLLASGGMLQRNHQLPDATILVFQGIVFLTILFSESLYGRWKFFQDRPA
jgi:simple sugar transport system permease protein